MQRWNAILDSLSANGAIEVAMIAAQFDVSPSTIRRDLKQLGELGLLWRTHGGAMPSSAFYELPLRYRAERRHEEKLRIARCAAEQVTDNMVVGLTGGTTTTEVARAIIEREGLTIVTNALNIAAELAIRPNLKLVVTGGVALSRSYELVGRLADRTLASLNLDLVFTGLDGISVERGLTTHHESEARTNHTLMDRGSRTIVVAGGEKLGRVTFSEICQLDEIDELITDTSAPDDQVQGLRAAGLTVTLV